MATNYQRMPYTEPDGQIRPVQAAGQLRSAAMPNYTPSAYTPSAYQQQTRPYTPSTYSPSGSGASSWTGIDNGGSQWTSSQKTQAKAPAAPAWTMPQWSFADFEGDQYREDAVEYGAVALPQQQLQQNIYQYGNDFAEAQRRWNAENAQTQARDQFNMGITGRGQDLSEWSAREAANQWGAQFNFDTGLANRQFGLDEYATREALNLQGFDLSNDARRIGYDYEVASRANAINQAYNDGRISNEQRALALQELQNQQQYGLGERGMTLQERQQIIDEQIARERMANDLMMARYATFGRAQAPNAQWQRTWG